MPSSRNANQSGYIQRRRCTECHLITAYYIAGWLLLVLVLHYLHVEGWVCVFCGSNCCANEIFSVLIVVNIY